MLYIPVQGVPMLGMCEYIKELAVAFRKAFGRVCAGLETHQLLPSGLMNWPGLTGKVS